jgi:hypothetical protein
LLDTLKERDGYINNLLVDTQPDSWYYSHTETTRRKNELPW